MDTTRNRIHLKNFALTKVPHKDIHIFQMQTLNFIPPKFAPKSPYLYPIRTPNIPPKSPPKSNKKPGLLIRVYPR